MSIHRVHWKVGDIVLIIGQGRFPILQIDDQGITVSRQVRMSEQREDRRCLDSDQIRFVCVADARSWNRGDIVYLHGVTPVMISHVYKSNWPIGIDSIELMDCSTIDGSCFTSEPLADDLEEKRERLEDKAEYKKFADALAKLQDICPQECKRWFTNTLESFENEYEDILCYNE